MMSSALNNAPNSTTTTSPTSSSSHKKYSPSDLPSPPFLSIEGIPNLRDLGSYPCLPPTPNSPRDKSYVTRPITLFRSGQLPRLPPQSSHTLTQIVQVRKLYDLRSEGEVKTSPSTEIEGVERVLIPVFRDQDYSPEGLARKYRNYTAEDEDASHGYSAGFVRAYRDIFMSAGPAYRRIFEHIRDRDIADVDGEAGATRPEPLLFHCAVGKDRTGVFAALVLRLCGVADDVIAWEYSLTEKGLGAWREAILAHMMKGGEPGSGTPAMTREEAERAVGSRGNNIVVFLNEVVDKEFGGVEKYMQERCGLGAEDVQTIRRRLVVEGESMYGDGVGFWQ